MFESGTKKLMIHDQEYNYTGEMDSFGAASGFGIAVRGAIKYEGTWNNDQIHGISRFSYYFIIVLFIAICSHMVNQGTDRHEQEFRDGLEFGKGTVYTST